MVWCPLNSPGQHPLLRPEFNLYTGGGDEPRLLVLYSEKQFPELADAPLAEEI